MIRITKIFRFEMAHAITGYDGPCKNIHGHSYKLHVTAISEQNDNEDFFPAPGFVIDFKDLKQIVKKNVIEKLDHKLVLSKVFIEKHQHVTQLENLVVWEMEPSAENILLYIAKQVQPLLPKGTVLYSLRLYETNDSYAEWLNK